MKGLVRLLRTGKELRKDVWAIVKRAPILPAFLLATAFTSLKSDDKEIGKQIKQNTEYSIGDVNQDGIVDGHDYWDMEISEDYLHSLQNRSLQKSTYSVQSDTSEITEEDMLIPFKQPNDRSLIWYGSGDVDSSGTVDWDDYNAMVSGIQNDMADVDGNGIASTASDRQTLEDYLNATIPYLPGMWNQLQTREERDSWIQNMFAIDQTDTLLWHDGPVDERWISGNFATQIVLNFFDYEKLDPEDSDIPEKYDTTNLGRLNIPIYRVSSTDPSTGIGHGMNATLVGDNPLNFNDWNFIEPQTDDMNVQPGGWNIPYNRRVSISGIRNFNSTSSPDMPRSFTIVRFYLDNIGDDSLSYQHSDLTLTRPDWISTLPDAAPPEITITHPQQDSTYTSPLTSLEYLLADANPDSMWVSTDSGQTKIYTSGGEPITGLQSIEGENTWAIYAKDGLGHESSDTVRFNVTIPDTVPPQVTILFPQSDTTYTSHVTELRSTLFDENPDSSWYSTDGGLTKIAVPWSSDTTMTGLTSTQGENIWIWYARDIEGNASSDSVIFDVDTTSVGIEDIVLPSAYSLKQNYPNPFNPSTAIKYTLPIKEHVSLKVYDIGGRKVRTLVDGEMNAGEHGVVFDGSDLASGLYITMMKAGTFHASRKLILLK